MTIEGEGFWDDVSTVLVGGEPRPTVVQDETTLTATLRASDLEEPGVLELRVSTEDPLAPRVSQPLLLTALPAPVELESLTPDSVARGADTTSILVKGRGFTPGVAVDWSNAGVEQSLPVRYLSAEELEVTVDSHLLEDAGSFLLTARSETPTSSPLLFSVLGEPEEVDDGTSCADGPERLCLNQERFAVEVSWETGDGQHGRGNVDALTADTGTVWFFDPDNVEVVVKVLDGCALNGRYWLFAAGLTETEVRLDVRDRDTGAVRTYTNPLGSAFQPILDTAAFRCR